MKYVLLFSLLIPLTTVAQTADTVITPLNKPSRSGDYVISQQERQQIVDMASNPQGAVGNVRTFDHRYEGLRGTPYLLPYWAKGSVVLTNGQRYDHARIKFDAFRQELVLTQPPTRPDSIIIDRERVSWFLIQPADSGSAILFRRYPDLNTNDPDLVNSYFRVLYQGPHALLQRIAKTYKPANYKEVYSPDIRYDSFGNSSAYYLLTADRRITKVKLSAKSLLDALISGATADAPEPTGNLRKQIVRNETDAVELLKVYDRAGTAPVN